MKKCRITVMKAARYDDLIATDEALKVFDQGLLEA